MTQQELREKIVETITNLNNICRTGCVCKDCKYENYDNCTEYAIADALIAANIGDVREWKDRAELAERVIANILCADACYLCNEKYGDCNVQHRDYGSKECVDRLLMLTKKDL